MRGDVCPSCGHSLDQRSVGESCKHCLATEEELDERYGTRWRGVAEQSLDGWTEQTRRSDRAFFESFNNQDRRNLR